MAAFASTPGDDPLQPYAVRAAAGAVGGGDGLGAQRPQRPAGPLPLARPGGNPRLHGLRPQRGDGLQPPGRPPARRDQPADPGAALAHGLAERGERDGVYRRLWAGLRGRDAAVSAAKSAAALCVVPVLGFLLAYSYTKRFTTLSHFWLGTALALAPLAAWVALRAEIAWAPLVLGGAVVLWVAGFDMIYACQDAEFDAKMKLASVPTRWGVAAALRMAARVPRRHGRAAGAPAAGLSAVWGDLLKRRGSHCRPLDLRASAGAAGRSDPASTPRFSTSTRW